MPQLWAGGSDFCPEKIYSKKKAAPEDVLLYVAETMYFLTPDLGL